MNTMRRCLDCGRCVQRSRQVGSDWRSLLCLLTRSPFRLRLALLALLSGRCSAGASCSRPIWRGPADSSPRG
ncbi:hypothetical protein ACFSFZ_12140 [Mixta tenebrionis]|uniref:Uncharacterized protein n=1 Tax=Mixta tenebrionis TaxID=2562439 RepID=A0A506VFM9_9GAMM|nr:MULTISPECIES: hypothetical protein [Mixta]QHM76110.1 hypothetical protein C7M52_02073 [Mixta theicola]TPW44637.1 hypothetical protein FKM52_02700 [Mixta tenebrionis]